MQNQIQFYLATVRQLSGAQTTTSSADLFFTCWATCQFLDAQHNERKPKYNKEVEAAPGEGPLTPLRSDTATLELNLSSCRAVVLGLRCAAHTRLCPHSKQPFLLVCLATPLAPLHLCTTSPHPRPLNSSRNSAAMWLFQSEPRLKQLAAESSS
jgi:hypothetical protein